MGWARMYNNAYWLPQSWAANTDPARSEPLTLTLQDLVDTMRFERGKVRLHSTSLSNNELADLTERLTQPLFQHVDADGRPDDNGPTYTETVITEPLPFAQAGRLHLAVADHFDLQLALPVTVDSQGGAVMITPPPIPIINSGPLAEHESLSWQVDLDFSPPSMPRGRGLSGATLLAPDEDRFLTWTRSGRDGITFESHRYNFVASGTPVASRLARPRLRHLSLLEWATVTADRESVLLSLSSAGRRVEILRRLTGSRELLADMIAGAFLPALRAFDPAPSRTTHDAYPSGDGVVLRGDGFLTFTGICSRLAPAGTTAECRDLVDSLLARRILRRGLILDCGECEQPDLVSVDQLAQLNQCARCGALNELTKPRWKDPLAEPEWFYDLHPAARELVRQGGEVPLLLSHYLRSKARVYTDVSEIEATRAGAPSPFAETDLIAHSDSDLLIAEAKRGDRLGATAGAARRAIGKRLDMVALLRAQQIILATTQARWSDQTAVEASAAIEGRQWPGGRPTLRLIAGLGSTETTDETH
jgi:hypothetical protein